MKTEIQKTVDETLVELGEMERACYAAIAAIDACMSTFGGLYSHKERMEFTVMRDDMHVKIGRISALQELLPAYYRLPSLEDPVCLQNLKDININLREQRLQIMLCTPETYSAACRMNVM